MKDYKLKQGIYAPPIHWVHYDWVMTTCHGLLQRWPAVVKLTLVCKM